MKQLRITISCLLVSFLLGMCGVWGYAEVSVEDTAALEAMEALRMLKIIPDYEEYNVDMNKAVSRAEFVDAVAKLLNAETYQGETPFFYDVPLSHWAFQSIGSLTEKKILVGNGDRLFYPDNTIAMADGYKIILSAMGYGDYAGYVGGYPSGYMLTANRIGMTEGIEHSGDMTNRDMFLLLYQAMKTNIFEGIAFDEKGVVSYTVSEHTLLSVYHNIYMAREIVNGANGVSITKGSIEGNGKVQIGDVLYDSEMDLSGYLAEEVEVFYYYEKGTDKREICWVKATGRSKVLHISVDHDAKFYSDSFQLQYSDKSGIFRTVAFSRGGTLIYNGGRITEHIDRYFNHDCYELKLVASTGHDYTVAVIREYTNYVVGSRDPGEKLIFDRRTREELNLNKEDYEYLAIRNTSSGSVSYDEIAEGDILSVYRSEDSSCMEVYVVTENVKGTIETLRAKEHGFLLSVNGEEYFYPENNGAMQAKIGDKVAIFLDVKGKVAYLSPQGTTMKAAYLMDASTLGSGVFQKTLSLKVRHQDGTLKELTARNTVKIDGTPYKDMSQAYNSFLDLDGNVAQQLILIETAEDGRVTAIDTAGVVEGENTLQVHVKRERTLWTRTLAGNGRIPMDGNTVIFVIPPPDLLNPEEEDYQVLTNTEGPTTATLYTTSYKTKEKVGCEQYVVVEWEPRNQTFSQIPILVEEIHTTRNTDGEEVQMLVGYQGKTAVSLLLDENVKYADNRETIVPGSLIHATVGKNGTIIAVDEYCNPQRAENKEKLYDAITNISDVVMGSVLDVVDTVVKIDARDGEDTDARINCASATVLFWDSQQRNTKIRPGTIGEILPEDYAVVELNYTNPRLLIVYR